MPLFSGKSPALRSFCFSVLALLLLAAPTLRGQVVISEVYGGGGSTATTGLYPQDFVELFNMGTTPVDISGWSVQYVAATAASGGSASATNTAAVPGATGSSTTVLAPGQRYLIAGAYSATYGGMSPLPTPDVTGSFAASGTAGHFFLVKNSTSLTGLACPATDPNIADNVAYGLAASAALCGAGGAGDTAPALTTSLIDIRAGNGCTNTNKNASDFATGTTPPRASSAAATPCGSSTPTGPSVAVALTPSSVQAGNTTLIVATVTKGTSTTISTVTADTSALGGTATQALYDDGSHGDVTAGDGKYSFLLTVPSNQAANTYTITAKATDGGSLTGTGSATLTTTAATTPTNPTITNATASPNPVTSGSSVLLTAKLTGGTLPPSTGLTLTGNLSAFGGSTTQQFYDDGTHGDVTSGDGTYSYSLTVPSGQAAQSYTVTLAGSDSNARTATGTITFSVQAPVAAAATITAVTANPASAVVGASVTLSATITGNKGSQPTGTPTFYNNGVALGQGSALANGVSTLTTTALTLGSHTITVSYPGDSVYPSIAAAQTPNATVTITAAPVPDFSITASNTGITLNDDQKTGIVTIAVNFLNGFTGPVALSCSGLPASSRCSFSPSSLSATGVSIMTVAVDGAALHQRNSPFGNKGGETALAFTLLALPFALRRKVRARLGMAGTMLGLLFLGAALMTATGCSSNTTPASTSTVTVTGTGGGVTHTTTFTLTAQ